MNSLVFIFLFFPSLVLAQHPFPYILIYEEQICNITILLDSIEAKYGQLNTKLDLLVQTTNTLAPMFSPLYILTAIPTFLSTILIGYYIYTKLCGGGDSVNIQCCSTNRG